ncbi:MAG: hypothetical protein ACXWC7_14540, partial [Chitinophagaceae bacterium]
MSQSNLNAENDFLVKESNTINSIVGIVLLAVFFVSMAAGDSGWSIYILALFLFLIPGAFAMARARRNATIIMINKTGVYYGGRLVTAWDLFYDAKIANESRVGSVSDKFILYIRYYSPDHSLIYTKRIPLSSTQDRG